MRYRQLSICSAKSWLCSTLSDSKQIWGLVRRVQSRMSQIWTLVGQIWALMRQIWGLLKQIQSIMHVGGRFGHSQSKSAGG